MPRLDPTIITEPITRTIYSWQALMKNGVLVPLLSGVLATGTAIRAGQNGGILVFIAGLIGFFALVQFAVALGRFTQYRAKLRQQDFKAPHWVIRFHNDGMVTDHSPGFYEVLPWTGCNRVTVDAICFYFYGVPTFVNYGDTSSNWRLARKSDTESSSSTEEEETGKPEEEYDDREPNQASMSANQDAYKTEVPRKAIVDLADEDRLVAFLQESNLLSTKVIPRHQGKAKPAN